MRCVRIGATAAVVCVVGFAAFLLVRGAMAREEPPAPPTEGSGVRALKLTPEGLPPTYAETLSAVRTRREELAGAYRAARTAAGRQKVLDEAREALVESVYERVAPHWYGTRWAYHGTSEQPGRGAIACGYFVSTVLRDVGFRVERVRMARQASQRIIESLTSSRHMRKFSNASIGAFLRAVRQDGEGLYIVGLDNHVGMLVCEPQGVFFVHSAGDRRKRVLIEPAETAPDLIRSAYRVYGKISDDDALLTRWLLRTPIPTQTQ